MRYQLRYTRLFAYAPRTVPYNPYRRQPAADASVSVPLTHVPRTADALPLTRVPHRDLLTIPHLFPECKGYFKKIFPTREKIFRRRGKRFPRQDKIFPPQGKFFSAYGKIFGFRRAKSKRPLVKRPNIGYNTGETEVIV